MLCVIKLSMRQQRQASQEVLQRQAALQRIVDRRQNSRRVVDSDNDDSGDEYRSGSPTSSQSSLRDSSNFRYVATNSSRSDRKSLQRLLQHKENKPETHMSAVASVRAETSNPELHVSADSDQLARSLAGLAIADNATKRGPTATVLAAAVATELPGEASDSSNEASSSHTAEANAGKGHGSMHEAGLHIAEFQLRAKTANMLYKHQIEGVKWLWSLHKMQRGGILGQCSVPLKLMFQDLLMIMLL